MAASNIVDPVADADRRVERAKASLRSRIGLLERKLVDVRDRLDVPEHIRRHPWPAVAIAFALGALAGHRGRSSALAAPAIAAPIGRSQSRSAMGLVASVGLRVLREIAFAQLGLAARRWLESNKDWQDEPISPDDDVEGFPAR